MASRIQLLCLNALSQLLKSQPYLFPTATHFTYTIKTQIPCTSTSISDVDLASDWLKKLQREEAMKKSKELLFTELCQHLAMAREELRRQRSKLHQEEKWVLIKGFVNEWGFNFHPLSARRIMGFSQNK
uniref:DUF7026 domain-containing protein n=1 Tax=Manihot esculenta TaxID=3983 RepID=A0A2C9VII9_MANES